MGLGEDDVLHLSTSMGLGEDDVLHLSALGSRVVDGTNRLISAYRGLLTVILVVSLRVLGVPAVVGFTLLAICLGKVYGLSLSRPLRFVVSQQQYWWRVLGILSLLFIFGDVLRCWWDAADVLKYVAMPCGMIVDMLLVLLYAATMHEGASLGGRALVSVALSYRAAVLMAVPPWVVSVFGVMVGTCVMAI